MNVIDRLMARRQERWRQTPGTKMANADDAIPFIEDAGFATLFPASPEVPSLYAAYMGDPDPPQFAEHDSPSGHVYSWRWTLGKRAVAFYSSIVRKRPTWVRWPLLPSIIRLYAGDRSPEELHDAGELSAEAWRIVRALEGADEPLATGELRRRAGFPTGKEHRAAYLKAVEDLESRLILAKVFTPDEGDADMSHALVRKRYPEASFEADRLTVDTAMDRLLNVYLPSAVFVAPMALAKALRLPESIVRDGCERRVETNRAERIRLDGYKEECYVSPE